MTRSFLSLRRLVLVLIGVVAAMMLVPEPGRAGDGQVVHVGEATALHLDGKGWRFDKSASRQAQLVSVQAAGAKAGTQKFSIRGLKPGQVTLVFRNGQMTYQASIDVLP